MRVLLCPDQPGWAFDNIANNIIRHAPPEFEVRKFFFGPVGERDLGLIFDQLVTGDVDLVHFFWREDLFEILRPRTILMAADRLNLPFSDLIETFGGRALTTSVYDHLFTGEQAMAERVMSFAKIDGYSVSSNKLAQLYGTHSKLPAPDAVVTDGVDLGVFHSEGARRHSNPVPVIGWVGNSAWGKSQGGDPKGYHRLFVPATAILRERGIPFAVEIADPQVRRIPFEQMPDYYRGIDILACTSAMEGTPNPVLEAMASGAAIVSTDVGIVLDALGPAQRRFVLKEPTPGGLADALGQLLENAELRRTLAAENLERISEWSWERCIEPWWPFWLTAYGRAADRRLNRRRTATLIGECLAHLHFGEVKLREPARRRLGQVIERFLQRRETK